MGISPANWRDFFMGTVYILYSKQLDKFYIGFTSESVLVRLDKHLNGYYTGKYTRVANDWELYYYISCVSLKQGAAIERHIKKMKSRTYIQNLKKYPEITHKLLNKYALSDS